MTSISQNEDLRHTWFGQISPDWKLGRAKNAFGVISKKVEQRSSEYNLLSLTNRGIIFRDIENGKGKFPASFDTYQEVKKNDIVFCLFDIDETPRTVGLSDIEGMITGAYTVVRCTEQVEPRFVAYFYLSIDERKGLRPFYTGLRKVVRTETFLNATIPLPDLPTQRAIADFLDHETARIDTLIEKKQQLAELLEEKRSSTISRLVSRGKEYSNNLKESGEDWIGLIPSHWETKKLSNFFHFRNEKNYPIKTDVVLSLSIARGITVYSDENRVGGNKRKDDLSSYKIAHKGDIVLNSMNVIVGAVGRSDYFGAISPVYYALYPINEDVHVPYFENIFMNTGFQKSLLRFGKGILMKISGTGKMNTIRMKISQDDLKKVVFPVPPIQEQMAIASYIEAENTRIDLIVTGTNKSVELLKEYRSALITSAVTGQIDVSTYERSGTTDRQLDIIQSEIQA